MVSPMPAVSLMLDRSRRAVVGGLALLVATLTPAGSVARAIEVEGELVVFAAASLKTALDEIARKWTDEAGARVVVSYGASSALAKQITNGAPADIFISADLDWMDALQANKHVDAATRRNLLSNRIVLIAHGKQTRSVDLKPGFDLAGLLGEGRLAMAMVDSVPAGRYGKAALTSLGMWQAVSPKVAQAENVRAALAFVGRGEAPYGIVYATDAAASDNVSVVATFPVVSHPPIVYPIAITVNAAHKASAGRFLAHLSGLTARAAFEKNGFTIIETTPSQ